VSDGCHVSAVGTLSGDIQLVLETDVDSTDCEGIHCVSPKISSYVYKGIARSRHAPPTKK